MSFSFRDKPRLSERIRGKSGDELINELKNHLDQERKMFFDTAPNWGSVHPSGSFSSRTGFPFDDDMIPRGGRQDIRAHLDDLAQRHPEFAEQLRCPPWAGEMSGSPSHAGSRRQNRRGSNEGEGYSAASSSSSSVGNSETGATSPKSEEIRGRNPTPQQVDEIAGRGQRSMSAPPDARNQPQSETQNQPQQAPQPQRYVSRVNITPGKPPVAPQKPQSPQQSASNVRHIPIFVEGRDEPILPKNVVEDPLPEQVFPQRIPPQPQQSFSKPQTFTSHHQFQPQQRFYSPSQQMRTEFTRPQQNIPQPKPETIFSQQSPPPNMQQNKTTQQPKEVPKPPQHSKQPQQPKPPQPNDPIHRVQAVQKDVENLQRMVENFIGTSRKDKQYIYLDEMLTRNLLKLDDIDTEGKENVRQARKEAIRSIQNCISLLESKVPAPEEQNENAMLEENEVQPVESTDKTEQEKMEDEAVEPTPASLENVGEINESVVRDTEDHVEKMDVELSLPGQHSETEGCKSEIKTEPLSSAVAVMVGTKVDEDTKEDKEVKQGTTEAQTTMDVTVDTEVAAGSDSTSELVASQEPADKNEMTVMEVEPPAVISSEMEAEPLPQQEAAVKLGTESQSVVVTGESQPVSQNVEPGQQRVVSEETPVEVTNVVESGATTGEVSEGRESRTSQDISATQVEPLGPSLEIKTEEANTAAEDTVKENPAPEQLSEKDTKQEVETKKKKTGKKVKSPSKKPGKQTSNSKSDVITSSDETHKS